MTNVDRYLEAVRERDAFRRAIAEDGETPARRAALLAATAVARAIYGRLNGSQIGALRRQREAPPCQPTIG